MNDGGDVVLHVRVSKEDLARLDAESERIGTAADLKAPSRAETVRRWIRNLPSPGVAQRVTARRGAER